MDFFLYWLLTKIGGNWNYTQYLLVLGNGPHVLGNGPHVLGNGPHVLRNGPHVGIKTFKIM